MMNSYLYGELLHSSYEALNNNNYLSYRCNRGLNEKWTKFLVSTIKKMRPITSDTIIQTDINHVKYDMTIDGDEMEREKITGRIPTDGNLRMVHFDIIKNILGDIVVETVDVNFTSKSAVKIYITAFRINPNS